jgi:hypothetical protein
MIMRLGVFLLCGLSSFFCTLYADESQSAPVPSCEEAALKASTKAILTTVGEARVAWAEDYATYLREREGQKATLVRAAEDPREQVLLVDEQGKPLGRFLCQSAGGDLESQLQGLSAENFFDIEPIVSVTLTVSKEKREGYLQRLEPVGASSAGEQKRSLTREIQKVGVLDVLLVNQGNDKLNVVVSEGRLIPTDHACCVLNQQGLDLTKRLMDPPFIKPLFAEAMRRPFWLRRSERFVGFARKPWNDEVKAFVLNWDIGQAQERLGGAFGVRQDRLELMRAMHLWLKKGIEGRLTLEEVSLPVYGVRGIVQDIPQLVKTARTEDAVQYAGIEYDLLLALQKTRQGPACGDAACGTPELFYHNLSDLFDRRIGLIKGKLSPEQLDAFYSEVWLNMFFRYELISRTGVAEAGVPGGCLTDVLELAKQLTALRLRKEYGSEASGMRDSLESVFRIFRQYGATLCAAKPGTPDYLRMAQFLRRQIDQFDELMVPGVVWEPRQNRLMAQMPVQDVMVVVKLVQNRAKKQAEQFQEKLGSNWTALVALQSIDGALDQLKALRDKLSEGKISQQDFDRAIQELQG